MKLLRQIAAPALLTVLSPLALAANDGTLGSTSTGDTDVNITIGDVVQVRVEQDVNLTYTPGSDSTGSTGVCVYRNSDADVNVTLTSANPDGSNNFRMAGGGNFITYAVDLTGATTNITGAVSGTANSVSDEDNSAADCSGGFSHSIDVTASSTNLDSAPAGTYADTITILAEPI